MTRNERRARLIAAIARRTGEALTLEAYTPGDWRGTRYRLAVGTDRGGLSTARYGNRWYNAAGIDAFVAGAAAATFAVGAALEREIMEPAEFAEWIDTGQVIETINRIAGGGPA
jgi:hypothetical protein